MKSDTAAHHRRIRKSNEMTSNPRPASYSVYCSRAALPKHVPYIEMLWPYWGIPQDETERAYWTGLKDYCSQPFHCFHLEERRIDNADIVLLPFDWRETLANERLTKLATRLAAEAGARGKMILVFFEDDSVEQVPIENAIVCRTSLNKSKQNQHELPLPAWGSDVVGTLLNGNVPVRPRFSRPSIGFCGFAGYKLIPEVNPLRQARAIARWGYHGFPNFNVRERAIKAFRKNPLVVSDFILREHFYAGLNTPDASEEARTVAHETFQRNVLANDYTLCARGGGNFSYRFYETLSCGRIPFFINTDSALPFEETIPYDQLMASVEGEESSRADEYLLSFHETLSPKDFCDLQKECRAVWVKWLSPTGFFQQLVSKLQSL